MAEPLIFIFGIMISTIFSVAVWFYLRIKFETFSYDVDTPTKDKAETGETNTSAPSSIIKREDTGVTKSRSLRPQETM